MRDMIAEYQWLAGVYAISTGTLAIGQALAATGRQEAITMIAHELIAHRRLMLLEELSMPSSTRTPNWKFSQRLKFSLTILGDWKSPRTDS